MSELYEAACEVRAAIDGLRDELADLRTLLIDAVFVAALWARNNTNMGTKAWTQLDQIVAHHAPVARRNNSTTEVQHVVTES